MSADTTAELRRPSRMAGNPTAGRERRRWVVGTAVGIVLAAVVIYEVRSTTTAEGQKLYGGGAQKGSPAVCLRGFNLRPSRPLLLLGRGSRTWSRARNVL